MGVICTLLFYYGNNNTALILKLVFCFTGACQVRWAGCKCLSFTKVKVLFLSLLREVHELILSILILRMTAMVSFPCWKYSEAWISCVATLVPTGQTNALLRERCFRRDFPALILCLPHYILIDPSPNNPSEHLFTNTMPNAQTVPKTRSVCAFLNLTWRMGS